MTDMQRCSYCGGNCPQSYMTGACDGFLGDIDGLDQDSMTDMYELTKGQLVQVLNILEHMDDRSDLYVELLDIAGFGDPRVTERARYED